MLSLVWEGVAESEDRVADSDEALDSTAPCSGDTGAGSGEVTCSGDETDSVADSFDITYYKSNEIINTVFVFKSYCCKIGHVLRR